MEQVRKILGLIWATIILPAGIAVCQSPGRIKNYEEFSASERKIAESFRKNGNNYSLRSGFLGRADYQITNRFNYNAKFSFNLESINNRIIIEDVYAKQAGSAFRKAGREALRDYFLDKLEVDDYIRGELGKKIKDSFRGSEEKNIIPIGYDLSEGLPERVHKKLLPKDFEWGARIFREKPFLYATFTPGDLSFHARAKRNELEFISILKIFDNWTMGAGMRYGWDEDKSPAYGYLGLSGDFRKVSFSLSAVFNGSGSGVIASCGKRF